MYTALMFPSLPARSSATSKGWGVWFLASTFVVAAVVFTERSRLLKA